MNLNQYIRLRNEKSITEFYTEDQPADYLKNIKDLNIIVGANNSRKSRFIRNLINLEHRVIVKSTCDINKLGNIIEEIFDGLSKEIVSPKLIGFIFNDYNDNPQIYATVKDFFGRKTGVDNGLSIAEIKSLMQDVLSALNGVAVPDNIKTLTDTIKTTGTVVNLILKIYRGLNANFNNFNENAPNDSGFKGITFKIQGVTAYSGLPDFEVRLTTLEKASNFLDELQKMEVIPYHDIDLIYIPVLRSARRLEGSSTDIFQKTLRNQHNIRENAKLSIETGLDLYEKIEAARNGHRHDRENFAAFENFISKVFFQGKTIDMIAVKALNGSDKHVKVTINDQRDDVPIHDLGDGIQTIISLLLPVFTAKDKSWIFVDEPENHLHPGFQNIFLRAISENETIKAKKLKFFISTHSNHILSESLMGIADTEILVFSARDKDSSNIQAFNGNEYNTLEMLGVFNTSVLITNCTAWVEGITDRLYIRAFLKAYCNSSSKILPVEGYHYSYVEYAGNNIIHFDFDHELAEDKDNAAKQIKAFFLNSNVFLIADSDFSKDEKHEFYDSIAKSRKNFEYFKTELPEIENLLPDELLKKWLIEDIKCKPSDVEACFQTPNENLKLGAYFEEKFSIGQRKRKFMDKGHGGTLRADYKMKLADYIHNGIMNGTINWSDLKASTVIEKLTERLYNFIIAKNGNVRG